jgi:hypothetical protein
MESINEKILLKSQANLLSMDDATGGKLIEPKQTKKKQN